MTKVYLIAEIGSTHDGSIGNAIEMVKLWADCGADAVKFQDHYDEKVPSEQPHPNDRVRERRWDYYVRTMFANDEWDELRATAKLCGVDFIVSPFSVNAAREQADRVTAFKVASGQVTNLELLRTLREIGKPVYLSSGMTTEDELIAAIDALGGTPHSVMHCTSEYPCAPERAGINMVAYWEAMATYVGRKSIIGFSDHTMGMAASLAAITLGARVIERHVTPSRHLYGSDAAHSLEPDEFRRFVREVRELERMLDNPVDKDALAKTPEMQRVREVFLART